MKKTILPLLLAFLPLLASADAVEIDGIWYNLIEKGKIAEVTFNPALLNDCARGEFDDFFYYGSIAIPEKVEYNNIEYLVSKIGGSAFGGCSELSAITIPNSVTDIGIGAFANCRGLTSVTIPNSVTSIPKSAFSNCRGLTSITIPNSITSIGSSAFSECRGLTSISIPNSVTSIEICAFGDCSSLTSVYITDLEAWCKIAFGGSLSNPLNYAHHLFLNGVEIKNLVIPNSVTSIGSDAFYGCSGLTSITIPNTVTSIGDYAFSGCSGLTSITIPNSVTSIGSSAFSSCTNLNSITIPNSVTSIGSSVFWYCSGLTSITIPNSITSIGSSAFSECRGLTSITIPNSVTSIGDGAFSGCSGITTIIIGSGVKTIYENVFANCSELTDVYCMAESVPITDLETFKDSYIEYATLHIPESSVDAYKTTAPWSKFGKFVSLSGEESDTPKCATPTISLVDGDIVFSCETDGVEYVSSITAPDAKNYYDGKLTLSYKYKVTVYATKTGYENSDTATMEITVSGKLGDLNADGKVDVADHVKLSDIIMNQNE